MTTEQAWTATITKIDPIPGKDRIVLRKSGTEFQ